MKTTTILSGVVLAMCAQPQVCCAEETRNTITVTGTATAERKPDVAYVTVFVKGQGFLMVDVAKTAGEKADAVVKAIREKHSEIKSVEVVDVEVGQKDEGYWGSEGPGEPLRPEIVKRVRVAIPPTPALAYELTDTAIRAGAVMTGPSWLRYTDEPSGVVLYGLVDATAAEEEACKAALANAMEEAIKTASLVGRKVGEVLSICGSGTVDSCGIVQAMGREADKTLKHAGFNPDKIEISRSLTLAFELLAR
ncbi:MAG: hypothetical protein A2Z18_07435 [Armatimonadetes bacterium RBG_16_58_9]|nr:MAG: hypothetical protein A2Z18_07435 [Armatimonadetes bacterium RBG_16_58_9]